MNLQKLIDDAIEVARASVPAHPPLLAPGEYMLWLADKRNDLAIHHQAHPAPRRVAGDVE